jgi:hypothetical protein
MAVRAPVFGLATATESKAKVNVATVAVPTRKRAEPERATLDNLFEIIFLPILHI